VYMYEGSSHYPWHLRLASMGVSIKGVNERGMGYALPLWVGGSGEGGGEGVTHHRVRLNKGYG
jgi:hypothetical protein